MRRILSWTPVLALVLPLAAAQNSNKKIRNAPSETAAKAGSAVGFLDDLDAALSAAEEADKPIFWYVPTIHRSFMDRKPEVDRYMLAGPFSWPRLIDSLTEHFVCLRMPAGKDECERFSLAPIEFIEPGFLVLSPAGEVLAREDKLTTHHPAWYEAALAPFTGVEADLTNPFPGRLDADTARAVYRDRAGGESLEPAQAVPAEARAEFLFLLGAGLFHSGQDALAREAWTQLTSEYPDEPLAWKAANELEGLGPLVHGFEVYADLPLHAVQPHGGGTRAPANAYSEEELWRRSTRYLLRMQRENGSFDDSTYDFGGTDGLPNVFMAVTAIATTALLERAADLADASSTGAAVERERAEVDQALARAFEFMADESNVNVQDSDELIWAHIYRMRCLCRWLDLRPVDEDKVRPILKRISETMVELQASSGAWAHEYANPFVTGNCLVALKESERRRIEIHGLDNAVARGTRALLACRTDAGAYSYGQAREGRAVRASIEGSVGRTPLGELALHMWAPDASIGLEKSIAISFEHEHHLLPAQKYDDHTRNFAYGGFFFWYDLHARTEAIAALPAGDVRTAFAARQRDQILGLPEFDGTFIDSHEIGKSYGTAMALWCLASLDGL